MNKELFLEHITEQFSKYISPVDVSIVSELLNLAEEKHYKKGEILLYSGETCHYMGYIVKGMVRSYYLDDNGNDITKNFHIEDYFIMDETLLGLNNSICIYEALEDCIILFVDSFQVRILIQQNDYIKNLYLFGLENGLRYKIMRENAFLTQNATERYINFKRQYPLLERRVKLAHIASYLGITPESLSRIRRVLRDVCKCF